MRVCRTPNNEKPEAKQIRKLLRQDSTFFSFSQPVPCWLASANEREAGIESRKTITEQKISLLKFFVQFFEFFRSRDEVKSRHFDEFKVSAGLMSYFYASQSLAIVLNFYISLVFAVKIRVKCFFSPLQPLRSCSQLKQMTNYKN